MKRLLGYVRPYWHRYALATFCTLGTVTLGMLLRYLTGKAIDSIQAHDSLRLSHLAGEIFAAALAMGVVRWFSRFMFFNAGVTSNTACATISSAISRGSTVLLRAAEDGDLMRG